MRIALVLQIFRNKQTNFRNDSDSRSQEKMCELEEGTYPQCLHTLLSNNLNTSTRCTFSILIFIYLHLLTCHPWTVTLSWQSENFSRRLIFRGGTVQGVSGEFFGWVGVRIPIRILCVSLLWFEPSWLTHTHTDRERDGQLLNCHIGREIQPAELIWQSAT